MAMFTNSDIVPWESHEKWFSIVLEDSNRHFYVGKLDNKLVGIIRFDKLEKSYDSYGVSINIAPDKRRIGVGKRLLSQAIDKFLREVADANTIGAKIKKENIASTKTFFKRWLSREEKWRGDERISLLSLKANPVHQNSVCNFCMDN